MAITVTHAFVSAKANGSDATLVQPTDWNASHTISLAAGKILGRDTSGAGAVQELPLAFTAAYDVTFPLTTGAITGALGTTAQRPGAPTAGMERWNSSTVAKELHNGTSWLALLTAGAITSFAPTGRLTLETGVPVSSTDQAGKATIYYTPAGVGYAQFPSYDGTNWSVIAFSELSNDTTASATNNAGAAAAGPYQMQDCFVWSNAGTNRLTRGPKWSASATATMTIATPCVVTWTAHGLWDGATVRLTTTGALPTGLTASTDYFITKIDANTFNLSTTLANQVAGTKIATSGTQSGVHTAFNYTSVRGTGAATTELQMLNGIYVNKYDITNGPAATKGTYVGSVYFNASSQIDLKFGGLANGGSEADIGIWNAYNRLEVSGQVRDSVNSWTYASGVIRAARGLTGMRVTCAIGLDLEPLASAYYGVGVNTGNYSNFGIGDKTTFAFSGIIGLFMPNGFGYFSQGVGIHQSRGLGRPYHAACERADGGTSYFYGDNGNAAVYQTGVHYSWRY